MYSLSWSGNHILSGSSDGIVQVYEVDNKKLQDKREAVMAVRCVAQLPHRLGKVSFYIINKQNQPISPPGAYYNSTRVGKVAFAPLADKYAVQNQFATLLGTTVNLWDLNQPGAPYRTDKVLCILTGDLAQCQSSTSVAPRPQLSATGHCWC